MHVKKSIYMYRHCIGDVTIPGQDWMGGDQLMIFFFFFFPEIIIRAISGLPDKVHALHITYFHIY